MSARPRRPAPSPTGDAQGEAGDPAEHLPLLARSTLERALGVTVSPEIVSPEIESPEVEPPEVEPPASSPLRRPGACFVTLRRDGELRGCVGNMDPVRPLLDDLRAHALAAAFHDPRFPPLEVEELADLEIEVSVLSPMEPVEFSSEEELVAGLRPGVDGVLLEHGRHRGTFLPSVWEQIPDPGMFLRELKRKAGLDRDYWSPEIRVWRYGTVMYSE